jgi:threonine dehydrogenase-like Zn-dependent dehydrogenase
VLEVVRDLSEGGGADVSFEAARHPNAMRTAVAAMARGGKGVLEGISGADREEPLSFDDLVFADLRVEGVFAYPSRMFARALELTDPRLLNVEPLITHRLPLAGVDRALELLRDTDEPTIKVLLEPHVTLGRDEA